MGRQLHIRHLSRTSANVLRGGATVLVVTILAVLSPAAAEKRVALVIGNSAYSSVPALANPRNDAEGIGAALNRLGFETTVALDADRAQMEKAVEEFAAKTETADVALFYYAGHGLQHQGVNYLIPTDASLQSAAGLRRLIKLNDIVADVRRAKALRILVLDACRDNPLGDVIEPQIAKAESGRSRSVGLAKLSRTLDQLGGAPVGAARGGDIVVYAAEAGRTAADGAGRNSPFTAAVLRNIEVVGQEIVTLTRRVAMSVQQDTGGEQRPELLLSVPFEFYFKPGAPQPPPSVLQLVPQAKSHEVAAIEVQIDAIVAAATEDREQVRREVMVLLSDIASRSGLKPDQIVAELPKAFTRMLRMREEIAQFRGLMESEPGIAPFVEIAAAAVASGRRPDLAAADQALAEAQARYDASIQARTKALGRAKGNRAALAEQRGNIAETELRSKEAAALYLAAANDTAEGDQEAAARRYAMAGAALFVHGTNFFTNDALRESIRLLEAEALTRLEKAVPATEEHRKVLAATAALVMAQLGDAQTRLGGRLPGIDGARMMVDARATYGKALQRLQIAEFPGLAMDILDRRAQRDLEFGRRITKDRGRGHFSEAVKTMRLILSIQGGKPDFAGQLGRTRNNLANALMELSKRTDGEEGNSQIDEAIALLEQSAAVLAQQQDKSNTLIVRTNLAHALQLRAARKEGMSGLLDMRKSQEIFSTIGVEIDQGKNPRIWAIMKQREAELLRLIGEREADRQQAFASLKLAFETYQKLLPITSRETAPNDWAMLCADMGYAIVAALPLLGEADRDRFAGNAVGLFENARPYLVAGGFGQDLERLDAALATARAAAAVKPR